ncbi:hypothetical protein CEXT_494411 [Caerostris extrusa]|uniref:Uncharacterized protein n=1 Tax=Caerostris extrusa TaxID=172846 RepID=A0AAV4RXH1_CAEEX|nr:hypothetical protein CEXT_494411 [Caerostris extrusa]
MFQHSNRFFNEKQLYGELRVYEGAICSGKRTIRVILASTFFFSRSSCKIFHTVSPSTLADSDNIQKLSRRSPRKIWQIFFTRSSVLQVTSSPEYLSSSTSYMIYN